MKVKTSVVTDHTVELTNADIVELIEKRLDLTIENRAQVFVRVPGGGDWSNTALEIDEECPIVVTWES